MSDIDFRNACKDGNLSAVEQFIKKGANVNSGEWCRECICASTICVGMDGVLAMVFDSNMTNQTSFVHSFCTSGRTISIMILIQ